MITYIVVGFVFVVVLSFLSTTSISWLNGLVPLFPILTLIGQVTVYLQQGNEAVKDVALVGLFSLIPYALYLSCVYFGTDIVGFPKAVTIGAVLWFILVGVFLFFKFQVVKT